MDSVSEAQVSVSPRTMVTAACAVMPEPSVSEAQV